jgi:hypothetical protein
MKGYFFEVKEIMFYWVIYSAIAFIGGYYFREWEHQRARRRRKFE